MTVWPFRTNQLWRGEGAGSHGLLGATSSVGAGSWAVSLAGVCVGGGTTTDRPDTQKRACGKSLEAFINEVIFELGLEG